MEKPLKLLFVFFISLTVVYGAIFLSQNYPKNPNMMEKASIFKIRYIQPNEQIIRVEIRVLDDITKDFNDILEVKFNNKQIPLLKADASGRRARKYYQVKPGTYTLEWKVSKSKNTWPRSKTYEKKVMLTKKDKFAYIIIEGDNASITTS